MSVFAALAILLMPPSGIIHHSGMLYVLQTNLTFTGETLVYRLAIKNLDKCESNPLTEGSIPTAKDGRYKTIRITFFSEPQN